MSGEWRTTNGTPLHRQPDRIERHGCGCVTGWDDVHEACVFTRCPAHSAVSS